MTANHYQRSNCKEGWLHKYVIISVVKGGLYERCERCGNKQYFPSNTPNWKYMEYHIRQALQPKDVQYAREYDLH